MDKRLYAIIDYILNHADANELAAIQKAIDKKYDQQKNSPIGASFGNAPKKIASQINNQIDNTLQGIRASMRQYVAALIKKHSPDVPEEHLNALLDEWVPDPKKNTPGAGEESAGDEPVLKRKNENKVPGKVLLSMVEQFIAYSTDSMTAGEQIRLHNEMPDWQERYWRAFPKRVRAAINLYLKGEIDSETCWIGIKNELEF